MTKDVRYNEQKNDLEFLESELPRAENLITTQLGQLVYQPGWGVDLAYFLNPDITIQAEAFENYLLQRIGFWGMNVLTFVAKEQTFIRQLIFNFAHPEDNRLIGE